MLFIKTLELTSDIVFKSFMLSEATRKYKAKLINSITGIPINLLENAIYTSEELKVENKNEKIFKTDIIVTISNHIISIEMNKSIYPGLFTKNLMYISKMAGEELERNDNYDVYKKIIQINLDTKNKFKKTISKFMMFEYTTHELEHDLITSYHIDLSKISTYNDIETKLLSIFVNKNLDEIRGMDQDMDDAINELERISNDKHIIGLYDKEKVETKLRNSELNYAKEEGIKEGIKENIKKGIKQGFQEGTKSTLVASIKRMKNLKLDDKTICASLDITLDEMKNLLN